jgi:hypothetical protein
MLQDEDEAQERYAGNLYQDISQPRGSSKAAHFSTWNVLVTYNHRQSGRKAQPGTLTTESVNPPTGRPTREEDQVLLSIQARLRGECY